MGSGDSSCTSCRRRISRCCCLTSGRRRKRNAGTVGAGNSDGTVARRGRLDTVLVSGGKILRTRARQSGRERSREGEGKLLQMHSIV